MTDVQEPHTQELQQEPQQIMQQELEPDPGYQEPTIEPELEERQYANLL